MLELMINDTVPYSFANKVGYGKIVAIKVITDIVAGERIGVFTERTYTLIAKDIYSSIHSGLTEENFVQAATKRLQKLRIELRAERISTAEIAELQSLAPYIGSGDIELLEAAGVPE